MLPSDFSPHESYGAAIIVNVYRVAYPISETVIASPRPTARQQDPSLNLSIGRFRVVSAEKVKEKNK